MLEKAIAIGLFTLISFLQSILGNKYVGNVAYMDEIFHYPEAINVCSALVNNQSLPTKWNEKITTPPGLYYSTLPVLLLQHCEVGVAQVRFVSFFFNFASLLLLTQILNGNHYKAMLIMSFPPLFFFGQLYYTDAGALFFILLAFHLHSRATLLSWMVGFVAVQFRQTNLIWILFIIGLSFVKHFVAEQPSAMKDILKRVLQLARWKDFGAECFGFFLIVAHFVLRLLLQKESIVHGDEENHNASLHLAQVNYFLLAFFLNSGEAIFVCFSFFTSRFKAKNEWKRMLASLCWGCLSILLVEKFTIVHPFILADNRHFTFYFYGKIQKKFKYFFVPFYVISGVSFFAKCARFCNNKSYEKILQCWGLLVAICLCIVPLPLVEPRYFIVPFAFCNLYLEDGDEEEIRKSKLVVAIIQNLFVCVIVDCLFYFRPFQWADGSVARFMW